MECNKDEAGRAKQIAEKKFTARDIAGAKKFALKAQNLYPGLEDLPQMLATLDVHLASENKISGEADWYGILGVNPLADDETVKKQYRKLALMLHPDKNKSIGADGAFKLISEAWSLLSDKTKRIAYDQKRFLKTSQQKVSTASGGPSAAPPGANGFHSSTTNNASTKVGAQKSSARVSSTTTSASRQSKPNTFWTACHRCKMQYEYLRKYLNQHLRCPNCTEPFLAVEIAAPPPNGYSSSTPWSFSQQRQNSNHHTTNKKAYASGRNNAAGSAGLDSFNQTNFQWGPFSRTDGVGSSTASASATAQAASVVQQAYEKVRREREETQAAAKRKEALRRKNHASKRMANNLSSGISNAGGRADLKDERPFKKRNMDDGSVNENQTAATKGGTVLGSERDRVNVFSVINKPNSTRDLSQLEIRNMLAEKARREIHKKLNEWSLAAKTKVVDKEKGKERDAEEKEKEMGAVIDDTSNQNKLVESVDARKEIKDKVSIDTSGVGLDTEAREPMSISVPDPDFHDFDRDRSERSFGENQVWAAYDDDDGMPRYYAMIHSVISLNPFKMRIGWLNSKTNTELGPLNWIGSGFAKTCGDFRVGKYEVNDSLNSFSHRVRWTKGSRGAVRIFPRKGDVWALYRNWSSEWNELTPDEEIHKYDMVEVLDDYNEEQGVFVTPLVKVAGFKTVFHRHLDPREVKRILREEMFRFSHQVPSYVLTGSEAQNAPKGCRELDPAATPLQLLQVITEVKEEEMVENAKEDEILGHAQKPIVTEPQSRDDVEKPQSRDDTENSAKQVTTGAKEEEMVKTAEEQCVKEQPVC